MVNLTPNSKMNKLLLVNFKRKSRNFKVALKNLKLNVVLGLDLKRPAVMSLVKSKNCPNALKKLLQTLRLKLKSQRDVKVKWPRSEEILKNPPFPISERSKPINQLP